MRLISFDVSSTTIGWAVFDLKKKIKLVEYGFLKPPKKGTIFERLHQVKLNITELLSKYKIEKVAIEDISQYMPGISSANTIITLALFNRTVGMAVYEYLNESPELFNVMAIRHGIKLTTTLPKKEEIPDLVEKHLNIKLKRVLKKSGEPKDELYDQADAIAVGLYCAFKLTNKLADLKSARETNAN